MLIVDGQKGERQKKSGSQTSKKSSFQAQSSHSREEKKKPFPWGEEENRSKEKGSAKSRESVDEI